MVAALLLVEVAYRGPLRQLVEDAPQVPLVLLRELAVNVPARLVGWDRIVLLPAAAAVLEEVHARIDGAIHGRDIEAGRVRKLRERRFGVGGRGGEREKGGGEYERCLHGEDSI